MAQQITNSTELLDGGQIENKLGGNLKPGQSRYSLDDKRCYDYGQFTAKYNAGIATGHTSDSSSRLLAHDWYLAAIYLRYGTTPYEAYNTEDHALYYYKDSTFNGQSAQTVKASTSNIFTSYTDSETYTAASQGYYMRTYDSTYYRVSNNGQVIEVGTFTPVVVEAEFDYRYTINEPNYNVNTAVNYLNTSYGWSPNIATLYKNSSDHKWYVNYNYSLGTWGALASGFYIAEDTNGPADSIYLMYKYKQITSGNAAEGYGYKYPTLDNPSYNTIIGASGGNVVVSVTSRILWNAALNPTVSYARINTYAGPITGNGNFTINFDANGGSSRYIDFQITDEYGLVTGKTGRITQAAYTPTLSEVPYYGFLDMAYVTYDLSEDKNNCYYSGQTGSIWYNSTNYTYYQDSGGNYTALPGYYMITQGMDGYPTFGDSEFLLLNY